MGLEGLALVGLGHGVGPQPLHHLERVRAKMADLAQLESLLATTIEQCEGDGAASCAVIDLLDQPATA